MRREDWQAKALCRYYPEVDFYIDLPRGVPPEGKDPRKAAKEICGRCPVREECLATAMKNNEEFGIWGGLTVAERRSLRRKALRAS